MLIKNLPSRKPTLNSTIRDVERTGGIRFAKAYTVNFVNRFWFEEALRFFKKELSYEIEVFLGWGYSGGDMAAFDCIMPVFNKICWADRRLHKLWQKKNV